MADRKRKPGPKPDRLKIEGEWEEAVKKALGVKRPEGGWPKEGESPESDPDTPEGNGG